MLSGVLPITLTPLTQLISVLATNTCSLTPSAEAGSEYGFE